MYSSDSQSHCIIITIVRKDTGGGSSLRDWDILLYVFITWLYVL
jgi:lipoate-protein ligase A